MALADWSKVSGADLRLIDKACHLSYGVISEGSESRYIHSGTGNIFYVSQGMSTWFGLIKPSSGTAKMKVGGIFKYYNLDNYLLSYLEIEVDSAGNIVNAKVVYKKREGGSETVVLEDDVTDKIQHLSGMAVGADIDVDDFEDGTTQGWDGDVEVVDDGYEGARSLQVGAECAEVTGCSASAHGYKSVGTYHVIAFLAKRYCNVSECSWSIEGKTPPASWGWLTFYEHDGTLDINCSCYVECPYPQACGCTVWVRVDTVKYINYHDPLWAFVKFYGYLKQIEGKWYLDIEVRVSNNYYASPNTSVEPSTTVISRHLVEIPSTIVGGNTKCGIILGREASSWGGQGCPNIIIDYTKLFY